MSAGSGATVPAVTKEATAAIETVIEEVEDVKNPVRATEVSRTS